MKYKLIDKNMKYKITDETRVVENITLHRIECVTAFSDVECGEKGGWIESYNNLSQEDNAWVYGDAKIYGNANIFDNARIYKNAEVCDNAVVCGNAMICENAIVCENAIISDNSRVLNNAFVYGNAECRDNVIVCDNARVYENACVYGKATICDNANVFGNTRVGGYAIVANDVWVYGKVEVYGSVKLYNNARVGKNSDYIVFKNWWSSGRYFTWTRSNNKWKVGCFYGSGEELIAKAYKDSEKSGREYERIVNYVNDILKEEDNDNGNRNMCED